MDRNGPKWTEITEMDIEITNFFPGLSLGNILLFPGCVKNIYHCFLPEILCGLRFQVDTPPPVVHASLIFLALLSERLMCTLRISMFQKVAQPLYLENGMHALNDS